MNERAQTLAVVDDATERAGSVILAERAGVTSYVSQERALGFSTFAVTDRLLTLAIDQLAGDRDSLRARHYHPYGEAPYSIHDA